MRASIQQIPTVLKGSCGMLSKTAVSDGRRTIRTDVLSPPKTLDMAVAQLQGGSFQSNTIETVASRCSSSASMLASK